MKNPQHLTPFNHSMIVYARNMGHSISVMVTPLGLSETTIVTVYQEDVNSRLTSADISENCRWCKNGTWLANDKDGNHSTKRNIVSDPNPVHYWCLSIYKHTLSFYSYQPTKALLQKSLESIANRVQKTSSILSGQMVHIYSSFRQTIKYMCQGDHMGLCIQPVNYRAVQASSGSFMMYCVFFWNSKRITVKIGFWLEEYDIYRCYFRSFVPLYPHHVSW